ncbi:hypothetical protein FACS189429_0520 [Bacteroidia bacterium]|nr:hypothetical protein FACS189429_0520 [Bacteroidia bacterium]GHV44406.1 hypothetical protein FACS1894180_5730 [Bacteroidia bacterium]
MNYDELSNRTTAILNDTARINALSLSEEQGRIKGGRRNVEATLLAATNARTGIADTQLKKVLQEKTLEKYALCTNILFDFEKENFRPFVDEGGEARVYADERAGYVRKIINPYTKSATYLDFLNRIALHNYVFNVPYELLGFTKTVDWKNKPILAAVYRQQHIQGEKLDHKNPEIESRFETEMQKRGFTKLDKMNYVSKDYIVGDLHEGNVLIGADGNFYFIDPSIELNLETGNFGGIRKYGNYEVLKI